MLMISCNVTFYFSVFRLIILGKVSNLLYMANIHGCISIYCFKANLTKYLM